MSDLHRGSRFLRLLRSICAKTACVRRAIVALFVAVATILATFMIMPSASMGASQQGEPKQVQTQNGNAENKPAADNKVAAQGEAAANSKAEEPKTVDPKNSQPPAKQDATNADHAQNVDSEKKQNPAVEDAKKDIKDAKKEESAKKLRQQKRELGNTRAAAGNVDIPKECSDAGIDELAKCYTISYRIYKIENKWESSKYYDEYPQVSKPEIKIAGKKSKSKNLPKDVWLELTDGKVQKKKKKETVNVVYETAYEWAFFKNSDGNYTSKSTENVSNSDGSIRFYLSKWPKKGVNDYRTIVKVHYPDKSVKEIIVKVGISYNNLIRPQANDLTFNIYNHEAKDGQKEVDDSNNSITIDSTSTDPSADDMYNPITPLFIHSSLKQGIGTINHRMVCNKSRTQDYSLDGINGLTLSGSSSGTSTNRWVQSTHNELKKRPNGSAKNSGDQLYEDDDYREQSRSWITGTPQKPGEYVCKVFAFKDSTVSLNKVISDGYVKLFKSNISDDNKLPSIFENPWKAFCTAGGAEGKSVSENQCKSSLSDKQGIDWGYKTIKIVVKSNKQDQPEVGDKDLTLKVYPFTNSDGSLPAALTSDNNKISAMLGMELKPFIDATSKADSKKTITLKMLCAKGEEKWSSNPDGLGLSGVPEDKDQTRCNETDGKCTTKNVASKASMEVSINPTKVGDYQCVVYALKQDVLDKFNTEVAKTGVTPQKISAAFASAKLTANKDYAQLAINIHVPKKFELPDTGGQNWNLQLGAVAAVMVSVLAAGFVISQSEACRKLLYERRRC